MSCFSRESFLALFNTVLKGSLDISKNTHTSLPFRDFLLTQALEKRNHGPLLITSIISSQTETIACYDNNCLNYFVYNIVDMTQCVFTSVENCSFLLHCCIISSL